MRKSINIFFLTIISGFSIAQTNPSQRLVEANNRFALDLYQKLQEPNKNLFFSPASVDIALLMTYEGAAGKTRSAFEKVLHLQQPLSDDQKAVFIGSHFSKTDSNNVLNFSNSLWVNKEFRLREDFVVNAEKIYQAKINQLDVTNPEVSAAKINNWVSDRTNNRIREVIKPNNIIPDSKMILLNTVYFNGEWNKEFSESGTIPRKFYVSDEIVKDVMSMSATEDIKYFEDAEIQIVKIPYKGLKKSFCIILPKQKNGLSAIENTLATNKLDELFRKMNNERVNYIIPKFKMENTFELVPTLSDLGLGSAFNGSDFSGISKEDELNIGDIIHKTFIEVSEKKTEAAAATEVMVVVGYGKIKMKTLEPPPKLFRADHPFLFMILDNANNEILFMGKYSSD